MHFLKSLQGSKGAIAMRPVSMELTLLLFLLRTSLINHVWESSYQVIPRKVNISTHNARIIFTGC